MLRRLPEAVAPIPWPRAVAVGSRLFYNRKPTHFLFPAMLNHRLQSIVEGLCTDGCQAVSQYIADMEAGRMPQALQNLEPDEQQAVLAEIKAIMAVYEQR